MVHRPVELPDGTVYDVTDEDGTTPRPSTGATPRTTRRLDGVTARPCTGATTRP